MPAALTHKAIMLMARERLAEIRDVVKEGIARQRAASQVPTNLETGLLALAEAAHEQMSTLPHSDASVPGQLFARSAGGQRLQVRRDGLDGPRHPGVLRRPAARPGMVFRHRAQGHARQRSRVAHGLDLRCGARDLARGEHPPRRRGRSRDDARLCARPPLPHRRRPHLASVHQRHRMARWRRGAREALAWRRRGFARLQGGAQRVPA